MSAAVRVIHDDYVAFCEGVRGLCDIDLLQYKRGQMLDVRARLLIRGIESRPQDGHGASVRAAG